MTLTKLCHTTSVPSVQHIHGKNEQIELSPDRRRSTFFHSPVRNLTPAKPPSHRQHSVVLPLYPLPPPAQFMEADVHREDWTVTPLEDFVTPASLTVFGVPPDAHSLPTEPKASNMVLESKPGVCSAESPTGMSSGYGSCPNIAAGLSGLEVPPPTANASTFTAAPTGRTESDIDRLFEEAAHQRQETVNCDFYDLDTNLDLSRLVSDITLSQRIEPVPTSDTTAFDATHVQLPSGSQPSPKPRCSALVHHSASGSTPLQKPHRAVLVPSNNRLVRYREDTLQRRRRRSLNVSHDRDNKNDAKCVKQSDANRVCRRLELQPRTEDATDMALNQQICVIPGGVRPKAVNRGGTAGNDSPGELAQRLFSDETRDIGGTSKPPDPAAQQRHSAGDAVISTDQTTSAPGRRGNHSSSLRRTSSTDVLEHEGSQSGDNQSCLKRIFQILSPSKTARNRCVSFQRKDATRNMYENTSDRPKPTILASRLTRCPNFETSRDKHSSAIGGPQKFAKTSFHTPVLPTHASQQMATFSGNFTLNSSDQPHLYVHQRQPSFGPGTLFRFPFNQPKKVPSMSLMSLMSSNSSGQSVQRADSTNSGRRASSICDEKRELLMTVAHELSKHSHDNYGFSTCSSSDSAYGQGSSLYRWSPNCQSAAGDACVFHSTVSGDLHLPQPPSDFSAFERGARHGSLITGDSGTETLPSGTFRTSTMNKSQTRGASTSSAIAPEDHIYETIPGDDGIYSFAEASAPPLPTRSAGKSAAKLSVWNHRRSVLSPKKMPSFNKDFPRRFSVLRKKLSKDKISRTRDSGIMEDFDMVIFSHR